MSKAFDTWWLKAKLPEFEPMKMKHYSEVRRIAMKAYTAGQKQEREVRAVRRK
jgi:hypothetical protein